MSISGCALLFVLGKLYEYATCHNVLGEVQTNRNKFLTSLMLVFLTALFLPSALTSASPNGNLQITTLTGTTINLTYEEILALPQTTVNANLVCYGNPIANGEWQGAKLSDILSQAGVDPYVESIDFRAEDGYSSSIPIDTAQREDVIVAYRLNGMPLGETLRLVVPGANGNIWIAMIISITMSSTPLSSSIAAGNPVPPRSSYTAEPSKPPTLNQPTPTPLVDKNVTTAPTVPPVNVTQPQPEWQVAGTKGVSLPIGLVYSGAFMAFAGSVVAYFAVHRRRKLKA